MKEDQLQKAVARLMDSTGLVWCHPPNGGNRDAKTGALMKAMGAKAGVPDCLIFSRGTVQGHSEGFGAPLAIELKTGKNKPTPSQLEWRDKLVSCGWRWECCYSVDEVLAVLRECYPGKVK
jgi:hypothetical protein